MFLFSKTDTDSLVYEVITNCWYTDMKENLNRYDTSDYPEDNVFNIARVNKKVPGLFKDELNSQIITEFVGLRSKMYSLKAGEISVSQTHDGIKYIKKAKGIEKMKKAKGVKKYVLKNQIFFDDFIDCLQNYNIISKNQNSIRSKLHKVYSIQQKKIALSPYDNKRYICQNKIDTLPWGHYSIRNLDL